MPLAGYNIEREPGDVRIVYSISRLLLYRGLRVSRPSCVLTKSKAVPSNVENDASQQEDTLFVVRKLIDGEVLL